MADGKVVFQIDGDARGVKATIKDVTNDIEKESKKWDQAVDKSSDDMTKSFSKAFDVERVKNWAIQAVKALVKFGEAAISAASDLSEVQNVVDVTFGDSAKQIDAWAQSAGKNFGLTETAAKKYASTIGAMLKSQGISGDAILSMSENLSGLAADMASFYNLDFDTAFEKIRSGISGETMPLKQLGINMSVANLEAFALEQGITKSYAAMSQGEQTMLRYQYLMKATADAQGDFARTSDGMANASRRVAASWETIKTKGGGLLMQVIEPLTSGLADFLDELTTPVERTVLDDFAVIDKDYSRKMAHMQSLSDTASDIVSVMEELQSKTATLGNGKSITFENLFGDLDKIRNTGGDIREYISSLGLDVDYTVQQYDVWREALTRLTTTMPTLTDIIDAQTGAIDGGTEAIKTNIEEFRKAEEKKYILEAYYAKRKAIDEKRGGLYSYQLDAATAKAAYDRVRSEFLKKYPDATFDANGNISYEFGSMMAAANTSARGKHVKKTGEWWSDAELYNNALKAVTDTEEEYTRQTKALGDADQQVADLEQALISLYGDSAVELFNAGEAAETSSEKSVEAILQTKTAAQDALKSLADYVQGVHDATEQAVDGIIKGFEKIERPTTEMFMKRSQLIQQQNDLNRATKDGEKRYQELQTQIDELNRSMDQYSPKGMKDALESQIAFMEEYMSNLEKAREMGLSDDLLAYLSDGSVQSAEYLAGLVSDPENAKEVDRLFGVVQEYKDSFTDVLTDQKLAFDSTYDSMVETAKNAIGELDMEDEARTAMESTMSGLVQGIEDHAGDVENAVATILNMLSRLSSVGGVTVGASSNGHLLDGSHETGLDYVPFDGYLASLHEGESILTAEENRIWQRFKNGASPQSMDYDALGATMRENVQAGGNVSLDGKTVGRVISDQQGNSYRQLQRSGWQA
jgi:hypothetical protein